MGSLFVVINHKCSNCGRTIENGEQVSVLIPDVTVSSRYSKQDIMRLKLSEDSLATRAIMVYCKICLDIGSHFLEGEKNV